jgi:hypothetical protein
VAYKQKVLLAVRSGDVRTVVVLLLPCGTRVGKLPRTQTLADHPDLFKIRPDSAHSLWAVRNVNGGSDWFCRGVALRGVMTLLATD